MNKRRAGDILTIGDHCSTEHIKAQDAFDSFPIRGHVKVEKTLIDGTKELVCEGHNALTVEGRDWILQQLYTNSTAGTRGTNFLALSTNATDTTTGDTTFAGEITFGGLARVDVIAASTGSITHTNDTPVVVISNEFLASAAHTNIHKAALFYSATATQPIHNFTFTSDTTLANGERLTITWTITIG